jgi:hypothetical protein
VPLTSRELPPDVAGTETSELYLNTALFPIREEHPLVRSPRQDGANAAPAIRFCCGTRDLSR